MVFFSSMSRGAVRSRHLLLGAAERRGRAVLRADARRRSFEGGFKEGMARNALEQCNAPKVGEGPLRGEWFGEATLADFEPWLKRRMLTATLMKERFKGINLNNVLL